MVLLVLVLVANGGGYILLPWVQWLRHKPYTQCIVVVPVISLNLFSLDNFVTENSIRCIKVNLEMEEEP